MPRLAAVVEGRTEQTFFNEQLEPHLRSLGIVAWARLPGRVRRTGRVRPWVSVRDDIVRTLKAGHHCTTMFDYYGLPDDWPGRVDARSKPWEQHAATVEAALQADLQAALGADYDPRRFIPYIQLHEFEALVFADVHELADTIAPLARFDAEHLEEHFGGILEACGHPEAINDDRETCPSRRITGKVEAYRKSTHGPIVTGRIGLPRLREACPHFDGWVSRLEGLDTAAGFGD